MKKKCILFFITVSILGFGQTYDFDFLTKYTTSNSKNTFSNDLVNYFNSDDFSYNLRITKHDKELNAILSDHKSKIGHFFKITTFKFQDEIQFKFTYDYSFQIDPKRYNNDYHFEFAEQPNNLGKEVVLKMYRNQKSKKPILTQTLTLVKANKNLFPIYRLSAVLHFWNYEELLYDGNFMISKSVEKLGSRFTCEINLKEYKNVNLQITLPNELRMEKFNFLPYNFHLISWSPSAVNTLSIEEFFLKTAFT